MKAAGGPEVVDSLRDLVAAFAEARDPRIGVLSALPESDRSTGALLATVLGQDIGIGVLARLVRELHARLGDRLLSVEVSDWARLERACRFAWLAEWPHKDSLAGWVLAVSDFLRAHGASPLRPPTTGGRARPGHSRRTGGQWFRLRSGAPRNPRPSGPRCLRPCLR